VTTIYVGTLWVHCEVNLNFHSLDLHEPELSQGATMTFPVSWNQGQFRASMKPATKSLVVSFPIAQLFW
jgi:hypothetical protein